MLRPLKTGASGLQRHEEIFVERYDQLLSWALQLTDKDRQLAEDLLHDAFIQFTLSRPDLNSIQNLDGYLYVTLRNLHLRRVRRDTRNRLEQLSIVEYDSAEDGLRKIDLRDQLKTQDDLRRVCHYAVLRKETFRSASVLILRYFHGYFPSEIGQMLRTSRAAVDVHLQLARNEARVALENAPATSPMEGNAIVEVLPANFARTTYDLLQELRQTIFQARHGACLSKKQLQSLYGSAEKTKIDCGQLAHMVSCPRCLDEVNTMLKLPLLSERLTFDTLGRDKHGRGGRGGPSGPAGGSTGDMISTLRRRAIKVFEHKPQELFVSVNGYVEGSHRVNAELNELNFNVNLPEAVTCVEIFSEQQVCMMLLNVEDLPPAGPGERSSEIELSDGRRLSLTLKFRSPWPSLQVIYVDPTLKEVEALLNKRREISPLVSFEASVEEDHGEVATEPLRPRVLTAIRDWILRFFWKSPVAATTVLTAVLLVAIVSMYRQTPTTLSGADLLQQSIAAEVQIAARADQVLHRTINLEERKANPVRNESKVNGTSNGELIARHRIEIWQSSERGVTARRLYDERGTLIAGDWRRADGVQTLYHHGSRPELRRIPQAVQTFVGFENVWQLSVSAKEFASLVENPDRVHVEEMPTSYVLSYQEGTQLSTDWLQGLVRATLTLNRADLHATELIVLVRGQDANRQSAIGNWQLREYRFTETSFERRSSSAVAPSVFEPEMELLGIGTKTRILAEEEAVPSSSPLLASASPAIATPELEIEVLRLLSRVGADMGEQVSVKRTPEGVLRVAGVVETSERRAEILSGLSPVRTDAAVKVEIETAAEVVLRTSRTMPSSSRVEVQRVEVDSNSIPVGPELRRYFGKTDAQGEEEIRRFSSRMINLSSRAVSHVGAMRRLVNQFSAEELRTLQPEARAKWLGLISDHAAAFARETASLRLELQPIFSPAAVGEPQGDLRIETDADLVRVVQHLFGLAASNYEVVRSALSASTGPPVAFDLRSPQFWRSLKESEKAAIKIGIAAQK